MLRFFYPNVPITLVWTSFPPSGCHLARPKSPTWNRENGYQLKVEICPTYIQKELKSLQQRTGEVDISAFFER